MLVCVIDGQGGGIGSRLIERLAPVLDGRHEILALGTNESAAAAMAKAGAGLVAVGEQAIKQRVRDANLILGPLSIVLPGALLGEVTAAMADSILQASGRKLLLPLNRLGVEVVGTESRTLDRLLDHTIERVRSALAPPMPA
jgi:NAD(P)-dependent dehydrogenase (short-subunit alcohol dehydrogenase family)